MPNTIPSTARRRTAQTMFRILWLLFIPATTTIATAAAFVLRTPTVASRFSSMGNTIHHDAKKQSHSTIHLRSSSVSAEDPHRNSTPMQQKQKSTGPPFKSSKKTNKSKPRSKSTQPQQQQHQQRPNLNNRPAAAAATATTTSVSSAGKSSLPASSRPPPLLLTAQDYTFHRTTDQIRRQDQDDTIGTTCVHYETCAGCTVGAHVGQTSVVQAARRYFAEERYDGGAVSLLDNSYSMENTAASSSSSYPIVIPSPTTGWRTQAKLVVANKSTSAWRNNEGCIFGLYQKGTHKLQAIPNCVVHHPAINTAVALLEEATRLAGTCAYTEDKREGDLRYVQLQVERVTGKVCLTLVWNSATLKGCQPSLARLVKALLKQKQQSEPTSDTNILNPDDIIPETSSQSSLWHSIWCHCNDSVHNNIFSRSPGRWHRLSGPEFLREPLPVADSARESAAAAGWLYFSPLTFRQGNLDGFEILALDVARAIPAGSKVCELYGGVGVLGLTALAYHYHQIPTSGAPPLQWLRCSDENPANVRCFNRAIESLPVEMSGRTKERYPSNSRPRRDSNQGNGNDGLTLAELATMMESGKSFERTTGRDDNKGKVTYMTASAAKALRSGEALGAKILIVDPPRKGLEAEVLDELCKPYNPSQPYVESATLLTMSDDRVNWANDVQTLIYVSCGFDALASDCDRLLSSKGAKWTLQSTTGYILFPGSDHVETLAVFQRS